LGFEEKKLGKRNTNQMLTAITGGKNMVATMEVRREEKVLSGEKSTEFGGKNPKRGNRRVSETAGN